MCVSVTTSRSSCSNNISCSVKGTLETIFPSLAVVCPHMFQVATLNFLFFKRIREADDSALGMVPEPSGGAPAQLVGPGREPAVRMGRGLPLVLPALRCDAGRRGISHDWLFVTPMAPSPTGGVPAVPPPSPSAPRP